MTAAEVYTVRPIGFVSSPRATLDDDAWGDVRSTVTLVGPLGADALKGLDEFTHIEVVFLFDQVDPDEVCTGSRHPRGNPAWPDVGILAQRAKDRPNRIGTTICRLMSVDGASIVVEGLDAVDGTPVLDVKPYMPEFGPHGPVRRPSWAAELMAEYF
ncbi:MAG TPA: SAM-dependent methyltransferase [Acidimicrobiales bacterium]|nr:SAM-dependent methyltransferase [Acidimicrobiales bacterium]